MNLIIRETCVLAHVFPTFSIEHYRLQCVSFTVTAASSPEYAASTLAAAVQVIQLRICHYIYKQALSL